MITITKYNGLNESFRKSKYYFIKGVIESLKVMFRYRKFVVIGTNAKNNRTPFDLSLTYTGLTPEGVKEILRAMIEQDDKMEAIVQEAKKIINKT
ncbi:MAG: hypothetical protein RDU14_16910 [Melioribacteraceae bacterium]|nr:hypothetical protein [Melioribacteraceae bacterium]